MENNLHNIIRANWDRLRIEKGLSVQTLADKLGVTRQTIYSYFRPGCSINTIGKASALIGVEPWQLLTPPPEQTQGAQIICPHCGQPITIHATKPGTGSDTLNLE